MFTSHIPLHFASSIFICSLIISIPSLLHAADESYVIQVGSLNCNDLASCGITECPDLPSCKSERNGNYWIHCKREGCSQYGPDRIGQVLTVCDYNCTNSSLPFLYDFRKKIELFIPEIVAAECVMLGIASAALSAAVQDKPMSLKRAFAYGCVGGLLGLNCIFANKNDFPANPILSLCGTLAVSAVSEYMLK